MNFGLPRRPQTASEPKDNFSAWKQNARCGYTNVACFELAKTTQAYRITFYQYMFLNLNFQVLYLSGLIH